MSIDEWMNALEPGDAWLRVAPIDRRWRQERVRVALPTSVIASDIDSDSKGNTRQAPISERSFRAEREGALPPLPPQLPPVPPHCPRELLERMGADILAKVDRRWPRRHHALGPCLVWTGAQQQAAAAGKVYGKHYDATIGRSDQAHRIVWRRVYGPIPNGLTVDHLCRISLCQRPDHLELVTRAENTRRRHQRVRPGSPGPT